MAILADDLIWATRLADLVQGAGAVAVPVRSLAALEASLSDVDRVIVDLTARAYDGVEAVTLSAAADRPVLAVGQHDDAALRRRAIAAGADRVHPYRRLFEDGRRLVGGWLAEEPAPAPAVESTR